MTLDDETTTLKTLRVLNRPLLEELVAEFRVRPALPPGSTEVGVSLGFTLKYTQPTPPESPATKTHQMLTAILRQLERRDLLLVERPTRTPQPTMQGFESIAGKFVAETFTAQRVLIPLEGRLPISEGSPRALTVWVGEPSLPTPQAANEWDFVGTYVLLVDELRRIDAGTPHFLSGVSALHFLKAVGDPRVNTVFDVARVHGYEAGEERERPDVLTKLQEVGGTLLPPQEITSIYRIAYMTDEQSMRLVDGRVARVNDLLAYPLAIFA